MAAFGAHADSPDISRDMKKLVRSGAPVVVMVEEIYTTFGRKDLRGTYHRWGLGRSLWERSRSRTAAMDLFL